MNTILSTLSEKAESIKFAIKNLFAEKKDSISQLPEEILIKIYILLLKDPKIEQPENFEAVRNISHLAQTSRLFRRLSTDPRFFPLILSYFGEDRVKLTNIRPKNFFASLEKIRRTLHNSDVIFNAYRKHPIHIDKDRYLRIAKRENNLEKSLSSMGNDPSDGVAKVFRRTLRELIELTDYSILDRDKITFDRRKKKKGLWIDNETFVRRHPWNKEYKKNPHTESLNWNTIPLSIQNYFKLSYLSTLLVSNRSDRELAKEAIEEIFDEENLGIEEFSDTEDG